jgi:TRAP-type C4-dicarboxylate transport system substrate-binding protein
MKRSTFLRASAAALVGGPFVLDARAQAVTLHGAVQFGDDHPFTQGLLKFQELVKQYWGKPVNFVLHKNSELGLEKDYFAYMNQGISVDYGIVSPAHMATFAKAAPFIDAPFVFRDHAQMNKVIAQEVLKPIADEIAQKADVLLIGYGGGGVRNIFATRPIHNMAELKGLKIRVQGAPIWTRTFSAAGMAPTVIAYNEIYNGIQTGVIQSGENEAAGVEQMKFYEVGPNLILTQHAISIRPICFSGKTLRKLPPDLQAAVRKAGMDAGNWERELESSSDATILAAMEKAGKLKLVKFDERDKLQASMEPVLQAYAGEIGADAIYARIKAIK